MDLRVLWSIAAALLELSGVYLIGNKNRLGFVTAMAGGVIWSYVALARLPAPGLLFVVVPAFFINIRNLIKWSK